MPRRSQISVGTVDDRSKNVFHWPRPGDREGVGMDRDALQQLFDMSGRVVVVTGGTRGIGLALAEGYIAAGAKVVVASRKADACDDAEGHLRGLGGEALGVATHLGRLEDLDALVEQTVETFGGN